MKSEPNKEESSSFLVNENILFSVVCVGFQLFDQLALTDRMEIPAAYLVTLILTAGSIILLSAHFPGASHLKLTKDGLKSALTVAVLHGTKSAPFVARRRFMGTTVEFMRLHPEIGQAVEVIADRICYFRRRSPSDDERLAEQVRRQLSAKWPESL